MAAACWATVERASLRYDCVWPKVLSRCAPGSTYELAHHSAMRVRFSWSRESSCSASSIAVLIVLLGCGAPVASAKRGRKFSDRIALAPAARARGARRLAMAERRAPAWHGFVSGAVAGASGTLVGHAFDTLKVHEQLGRRAGALSLRVLYRGVLPPLLSTGTIRSLNFGIFERAKSWLHGPAAGAASSNAIFAAGVFAGAALTPLTSPLVMVKIHQQAHGGSLRDCVASVWRVRGIRAFYVGFPMHAVCESFGNGCYLLSYHLAKDLATRQRGAWAGESFTPGGEGGADQLPMTARIACGALAGCAGWFFIYPFDVLRSRLISAAGAADSAGAARLGAWQAAVLCYRDGGAGAFFRGIRMTLIRAAPTAGVTLPVYDAVGRMLHGLAGGNYSLYVQRHPAGERVASRGDGDREASK